jgi:hypothetical protein
MPLKTLRDVAGPIGLALLDGWKDLCLPVPKLLEPRLADGALVVGDDIDLLSMTDYLNYVRDLANGYVSVAFPVEDGMEISCRSGLHGEAPHASGLQQGECALRDHSRGHGRCGASPPPDRRAPKVVRS